MIKTYLYQLRDHLELVEEEVIDAEMDMINKLATLRGLSERYVKEVLRDARIGSWERVLAPDVRGSELPAENVEYRLVECRLDSVIEREGHTALRLHRDGKYVDLHWSWVTHLQLFRYREEVEPETTEAATVDAEV